MTDNATPRPARTRGGGLAAPLSEVRRMARRLDPFTTIFIVSLVVPLMFNLGPFRLSTYRFSLLILFLPVLLMLVRGRAGRLHLCDFSVFFFAIWMALSEFYHRGGEGIESIGITTLETLGAYLIGRTVIRSPETFRKASMFLFATSMTLLPFAIYETLTGHNITLQFWSAIGQTNPDVPKEARLGLDRVQGPFDHPILFGVFYTPVIGLAYYVAFYEKSAVTKFMIGLLVFATGFLALSSGPISASVVQVGLMFWYGMFNRIPGQWWMLLGLLIVMYVAVDIASNRTPLVVAISYLALNIETGLGRIMIWDWGWVNILEHPVFGIGIANDWVRHEWLTASFDMYWLLFMMYYGMPAGLAHWGSYLFVLFPLMFRTFRDPRIRSYRMGWIVGSFGMMMAGWMVHFWNAPLALHFFLLGSGVWLISYAEDDAGKAEEGPPESGDRIARSSRYTRFDPVGRGQCR